MTSHCWSVHFSALATCSLVLFFLARDCVSAFSRRPFKLCCSAPAKSVHSVPSNQKKRFAFVWPMQRGSMKKSALSRPQPGPYCSSLTPKLRRELGKGSTLQVSARSPFPFFLGPLALAHRSAVPLDPISELPPKVNICPYFRPA